MSTELHVFDLKNHPVLVGGLHAGGKDMGVIGKLQYLGDHQPLPGKLDGGHTGVPEIKMGAKLWIGDIQQTA